MKLFGYEIKRSAVEKQASQNIYGIADYQTQRGLSDDKGNKDEMIRSYASWVYACATKRAQSVARAKFRLYRRNASDDYTELDDHNSLIVLEKPNPIETRYQYLFRTILHMDLTGDAYSWIVKDRSGRIRELWTLQPEQMYIIPKKDGTISHYELRHTVNSKPIIFKPEEIIHYKHPSPINPYYGASVIMAAAQSVDINDFQHNYQRNFYKRSALPPAVLETENKIDEAVLRKLRENFDSVYGGEENAGRTLILENGLKYKQLGINPKDLDWLATNRYTLQEICVIFGVPPSMLGIVEDVNRANAESQEYTYAKMTVEPLLTNIEEQLTQDLVRQYLDGAKLFIQHDSTVPMDEDRKASAAQKRIFAGMTTINEERKLDGYQGIGSDGDVHLVPANYMPLAQMISREVTQEGQQLQSGQLDSSGDGSNDNDADETNAKG